MSTNGHIDQLCQRVENYFKTSIDLYKFIGISKLSNVISAFAILFLSIIMVLAILLFSSIGLAYWLGLYLGKVYYGFLIVALLYIALMLILYVVRNRFIKSIIHNSLLKLFQK